MRQTWRTEISKYPEEKKSTEIPLVVTSERGLGQWLIRDNQKCLEKHAIVGDSPVWVNAYRSLSRAGHVKPCLNTGGSPSKPKYSLMTDSELVP